MVSKYQAVKKACEINDMIFKEICENFSFKTEKEVANYILKRFKQEGVKPAYPPIVANNYSVIHPKPRTKPLKKGFLLMDFGAKYAGYCSDMTRTVFLGKASAKEKKLYKLLYDCQQKCVRKVKIGASCFELEVYSRRILGDYRKYYTHQLGHGVGKKIHEAPRFGALTTALLKNGDIITIEPGIYKKTPKEEWGIRIEDTIAVKKKVEVLSKAAKKFIEIPFGKR